MDNTKITLLEKYFPRNWESVLLPTKIKTLLNETTDKRGYRLMMYSSPGTGKTTTSRILTMNDEVMYVSGSNDFNTARYNQIAGFASSSSAVGKQKTVVIDEAENIRNNLQDAFKILLDKCVSCNFIFITNEVDKMNDAVRSRCTKVEYDFIADNLEEQKKNFINFTVEICKAESIVYDKLGMRALFRMIFPDFRQVLVTLQEFKDTRQEITELNIKRMSDNGKENLPLYNIIENPAVTGKDLYAEATKFKGREKECLISLGEPFFEYLNDKQLHTKTLEVAMIVSKYCDSYVTSINKFVTFMSCIVELKALFR